MLAPARSVDIYFELDYGELDWCGKIVGIHSLPMFREYNTSTIYLYMTERQNIRHFGLSFRHSASREYIFCLRCVKSLLMEINSLVLVQ